jgi:hypothetical protein
MQETHAFQTSCCGIATKIAENGWIFLVCSEWLTTRYCWEFRLDGGKAPGRDRIPLHSSESARLDSRLGAQNSGSTRASGCPSGRFGSWQNPIPRKLDPDVRKLPAECDARFIPASQSGDSFGLFSSSPFEGGGQRGSVFVLHENRICRARWGWLGSASPAARRSPPPHDGIAARRHRCPPPSRGRRRKPGVQSESWTTNVTGLPSSVWLDVVASAALTHLSLICRSFWLWHEVK